jgi:hypothetical protein
MALCIRYVVSCLLSPLCGGACVEICPPYPIERAAVAAAGQASRFQAFNRVYIKPENGNGLRMFSLSPGASEIVQPGRKCRGLWVSQLHHIIAVSNIL